MSLPRLEINLPGCHVLDGPNVVPKFLNVAQKLRTMPIRGSFYRKSGPHHVETPCCLTASIAVGCIGPRRTRKRFCASIGLFAVWELRLEMPPEWILTIFLRYPNSYLRNHVSQTASKTNWL